jgi:hypothetical protein
MRSTIAYIGLGIGLALAPFLFDRFAAKDLIAAASLLFFVVAIAGRIGFPMASKKREGA